MDYTLITALALGVTNVVTLFTMFYLMRLHRDAFNDGKLEAYRDMIIEIETLIMDMLPESDKKDIAKNGNPGMEEILRRFQRREEDE